MMHSVAAPGESAGARPIVSLVVVNARIWTGRAARPWADALAVSGKLLAAVGSSAEIRKLAGSEARVVDAARGLLVPGADDDNLSRALAAMVAASALDTSADTGQTQGPVLARGNPADFTLFERDPTGALPVHPGAPEPTLVVVEGAILRDRSTSQP